MDLCQGLFSFRLNVDYASVVALLFSERKKKEKEKRLTLLICSGLDKL
jgi:hypothetical protein